MGSELRANAASAAPVEGSAEVVTDSAARVDPGLRAEPKHPAEGADREEQEPAAKRQPIRFSVAPDSDRRELTLFVKKGILPVLGPGGHAELGHFEPLCRAPCEFRLRSDTHVFGVAHDENPVIQLDRALPVRRGQELVVRYDGRRSLRITGWIVLLGSVAAGSALIALGQPLEAEAKIGMIVGGALLSVLGLGGGLWLANLPDRASGWVKP